MRGSELLAENVRRSLPAAVATDEFLRNFSTVSAWPGTEFRTFSATAGTRASSDFVCATRFGSTYGACPPMGVVLVGLTRRTSADAW
jgi:hypothetical protein